MLEWYCFSNYFQILVSKNSLLCLCFIYLLSNFSTFLTTPFVVLSFVCCYIIIIPLYFLMSLILSILILLLFRCYCSLNRMSNRQITSELLYGHLKTFICSLGQTCLSLGAIHIRVLVSGYGKLFLFFLY